jgi:hypothetical protein
MTQPNEAEDPENLESDKKPSKPNDENGNADEKSEEYLNFERAGFSRSPRKRRKRCGKRPRIRRATESLLLDFHIKYFFVTQNLPTQ